MPSVTFILNDGSERAVETPADISLMEVAVMNGVDGIVAQCGGALCCATCHVYVDPTWVSKLPNAQDLEVDMLSFVAAEQKLTSRLSCQIKVTDALDGLVVAIPAKQTAT